MAAWSAPCSPCILPESVLVVPVVPALPAGVVSHRTDSLERRTHDCHSSDGVLYDARHRSQNITQLAPACASELRCPSNRCTPQMFDARASPAVGYPECSPYSATCSRFSDAHVSTHLSPSHSLPSISHINTH